MKRLAAVLACAALLAPERASAEPLKIVTASQQSIGCGPGDDCVLLSDPAEPAEPLMLGSTASVRLRSRVVSRGQEKASSEALRLYSYQLELDGPPRRNEAPCPEAIDLPFGEIVRLDYDGDGTLDDGGVISDGAPAPSFEADLVDGRLRLTLDPGGCKALVRRRSTTTLIVASFALPYHGSAEGRSGSEAISFRSIALPERARAIAFTANHFRYPCNAGSLFFCWSLGLKLQAFVWGHPGTWQMSSPRWDRDVQANRLTDPSRVGGSVDLGGDGRDEDTVRRGADTAQLALICSHGSFNALVGPFYYSQFSMGSSDDTDLQSCSPDTANHIIAGNDGGKLEILIAATCSSVQPEVWELGKDGAGGFLYDQGYWRMRTDNGAFTTVLGFQGDSYDLPFGFSFYLWSSTEHGLGANWLSVMRKQFFLDQCPAAIVFCADEAHCDEQFTEAGLEDRHHAGADTRYGKLYSIADCQPPGVSDAGADLRGVQ